MCDQHHRDIPAYHNQRSLNTAGSYPQRPGESLSTISCYLHMLDPIEDSQQVTCMTTEECQQAQLAYPILNEMIIRMQDGTLEQYQIKPTDPVGLKQLLQECTHLKLRKGILYQKVLSRESLKALFQLALLTMHRETTLKGCNNEIGHSDLERMLDLMHDHFFWPQMAVQAKKHVEKCCQCIIFKAEQQRAPMEKTVVTCPLELVHIDYLCLEHGKR